MAGQFDVQMIREYLLGQIANGSQAEFEKSLLTDDQWFEELLVVEDELIDDYLDGKLTADERERFEKHFLATAERRQKLRFGRALKKYVSTPAADAPEPELRHVRDFRPSRPQWSWTNVFSSSPLRIAVSAIVILGLAFGLWRVFFHQSDVDKGLVALNAAYREQRPIESRISALTSYAPFSQTRGPGVVPVNENDLRRSELTLRDALASNPTPAAHHALGEVYLAKKQFDAAIKEFEEALKGDAKNAKLYSDLGAAHLEKGKVGDLAKTNVGSINPEASNAVEELARGLEYLGKALELDPNLLEALFNRAICHEKMGLPHAARDDWREFLKKDANSSWANEARRNLKSLEEHQNKNSQTKQELMQSFLNAQERGDDEKAWAILGASRDDLSGTNIAQQLLAASLESAVKSNDGETSRDVHALAYLGDLERKRAGEYYNDNLARLYRGLTRVQQAQLIQAHSFMNSGYEHYRNSIFNKAIEDFKKAQVAFVDAGDQEEFNLAQYWIGYCHFEASQTQLAVAIFERLATNCQSRRYQWLLMRTLFSMANARFSLNEYSEAIDYCRRSLDLAKVIGDYIGAFNVFDALTEFHRSLSNYPQALKDIGRSLALIDCCSFNPVKVWRHYAIAAAAFSSSGLYRAAIDYQKEALERALVAGETSMICVSYAQLGSMYGKLGDFDEGVKNVRLAYDKATQRQNDSSGKEMMAYSSLQLGHLYREARHLEKAVESYNQAIALYDNLEFPVFLYQAHKGRLICYLAQTNDSLATKEIQKTLELAENYRSTILEGNSRNSFFNMEQSVYDLATDFAYSRLRDSAQAFNYAESSRARSLLDLMNARPAMIKAGGELRFTTVFEPFSLSKIEHDLPAEVQIVEYSVLANKVLISIVDQRGLNTMQAPITQTDLDQKVRQYLKTISNPSDTPNAQAEGVAKELHEILIRPVESLLEKDKQTVIIPDKILNLLPFGALLSPTSNRYLVEDYCLTYAPSAAVFLRATRNAEKQTTQRSEKLVSVGNPSFDHDAFPFLDDLPAAAREATEIALYYKPGRSLIGPAALKTTLENELVNAEVVHFATHSINEEGSALGSKLVLTQPQDKKADGREDGVLPAYEIYSLSLSRTKVVVLSACQTGLGLNYAGEGTLSLARSFLVSGVPIVIASLWPIDSESTAALMISFHRHRTLDHLSSAKALRQAQLELLAQSDRRLRHPYFWAPFFALGGYARF